MQDLFDTVTGNQTRQPDGMQETQCSLRMLNLTLAACATLVLHTVQDFAAHAYTMLCMVVLTFLVHTCPCPCPCPCLCPCCPGICHGHPCHGPGLCPWVCGGPAPPCTVLPESNHISAGNRKFQGRSWCAYPDAHASMCHSKLLLLHEGGAP